MDKGKDYKWADYYLLKDAACQRCGGNKTTVHQRWIEFEQQKDKKDFDAEAYWELHGGIRPYKIVCPVCEGSGIQTTKVNLKEALIGLLDAEDQFSEWLKVKLHA